jgi:uncharacterized protein (TIGR02594 family)
MLRRRRRHQSKLSSDVPKWLAVMRAITGTTETPGDADNPKIVGMADFIAHTFPEMANYCDEYTHDEIAWCGLTAAFCMSVCKIRPPFGPTDTDRFLWALSWAGDDNGYFQIDTPRPGCVVVMEREGGGHVTFYERTEGSKYVCRGGNQSDAVNEQSYSIDGIVALMWPDDQPLPDAPRRELSRGDTGEDVAYVQRTLGLEEADGDFGSITEAAVMGYQAAMGLGADGVVGQRTWEAIDDLDARMSRGDDGLDEDIKDAIVEVAEQSEIAGYSWPGRGDAPIGYIAGMALCFALVVTWLNTETDPWSQEMAQADRDDDYDALTVYRDQFARLGMDNSEDGIDTLRHLFVLMIGLGMQESSGCYFEGRDMSASNVEPDTCEAGLFQASWNIASTSDNIPEVFDDYWQDPNGFLSTFWRGATPEDPVDLKNYGDGDAGTQYQWLAKYSPAFAVMVAALGLRTRCNHWGPINRGEVTLNKDADKMLQEVQDLVEGVTPRPPRPPRPDDEVPTVTITVSSSAPVNITVIDQTEVS